MSYIKKLLAFFSGNKETKQHSKRDAQIKYSSSVFFLIGLITTTLVVAMIANTKFKTPEIMVGSGIPDEIEQEYYGNFTIEKEIVPVKKKEVKKEPVKKKSKEEIKVIDNTSKEKETVTDKTDETKTDTTDKPAEDTVDKSNETTGDDNTNYTYVGVEMVPVFPGCETLINNNARKECMSTEINKLINKRFNTSLAEELNLTGKQSIYVTFIVNKNGQVADVQVRAPHPRLEKEARRVVNLIPNLSPGMQNNKPVNVMYSLPIIFNVE